MSASFNPMSYADPQLLQQQQLMSMGMLPYGPQPGMMNPNAMAWAFRNSRQSVISSQPTYTAAQRNSAPIMRQLFGVIGGLAEPFVGAAVNDLASSRGQFVGPLGGGPFSAYDMFASQQEASLMGKVMQGASAGDDKRMQDIMENLANRFYAGEDPAKIKARASQATKAATLLADNGLLRQYAPQVEDMLYGGVSQKQLARGMIGGMRAQLSGGQLSKDDLSQELNALTGELDKLRKEGAADEKIRAHEANISVIKQAQNGGDTAEAQALVISRSVGETMEKLFPKGIEDKGKTRGFNTREIGDIVSGLGEKGLLKNKDQMGTQLEEMTAALDAVRHFMGDPNAPVPQLMAALDSLTGGGMGTMETKKLTDFIYKQKAMGRVLNISAEAMTAYTDASGAYAKGLGLDPRLGVLASQTSMTAAGAAWQSQEQDQTPSLSRVTREEMMQLKQRSVLEGLSSPVTAAMASLARMQELAGGSFTAKDGASEQQRRAIDSANRIAQKLNRGEQLSDLEADEMRVLTQGGNLSDLIASTQGGDIDLAARLRKDSAFVAQQTSSKRLDLNILASQRSELKNNLAKAFTQTGKTFNRLFGDSGDAVSKQLIAAAASAETSSGRQEAMRKALQGMKDSQGNAISDSDISNMIDTWETDVRSGRVNTGEYRGNLNTIQTAISDKTAVREKQLNYKLEGQAQLDQALAATGLGANRGGLAGGISNFINWMLANPNEKLDAGKAALVLGGGMDVDRITGKLNDGQGKQLLESLQVTTGKFSAAQGRHTAAGQELAEIQARLDTARGAGDTAKVAELEIAEKNKREEVARAAQEMKTLGEATNGLQKQIVEFTKLIGYINQGEGEAEATSINLSASALEEAKTPAERLAALGKFNDKGGGREAMASMYGVMEKLGASPEQLAELNKATAEVRDAMEEASKDPEHGTERVQAALKRVAELTSKEKRAKAQEEAAAKQFSVADKSKAEADNKAAPVEPDKVKFTPKQQAAEKQKSQARKDAAAVGRGEKPLKSIEEHEAEYDARVQSSAKTPSNAQSPAAAPADKTAAATKTSHSGGRAPEKLTLVIIDANTGSVRNSGYALFT